MSMDESEKPYGDSCITPLRKEDWEKTAEPGETYESYIRRCCELFGIVCLHHRQEHL